MKSFKDFIIEGKKSNNKAAERKPTIEIMPKIRDGEKGMVTKPDNAGTHRIQS